MNVLSRIRIATVGSSLFRWATIHLHFRLVLVSVDRWALDPPSFMLFAMQARIRTGSSVVNMLSCTIGCY